MGTLSEYFRTEAREFLAMLDRLVDSGRPDAAELHRAARGLRGTAQMAREERFFRAVSAFENATRSLAAGALSWSDDVNERARATLADLRQLLEPAETDELEARAARVAARWQPRSPAAPPPAATAAPAPGDEFRRFAGREVADIADTLDQSIHALQSDPMDREPLRAVLRRQRALLGAARLDEIPVVAEILRAVEDVTRVVAKLDVGVKKEWLDVYRVARDGLQATIATLLRGESPERSNALSRLRHMRNELLERYGEGELVSTAHDQGLVQAQPALSASAAAVADPLAPPDEHVLELGYRDAPLDEADDVLELDDAAIVQDEDVLELDDAAIVEVEDVLELEELDVADGVAERGVIPPATHGPVLELESSQIIDEPDGAAALRRAQELRDIVARAAAHDPPARAALDELFGLLRRALE